MTIKCKTYGDLMKLSCEICSLFIVTGRGECQQWIDLRQFILIHNFFFFKRFDRVVKKFIKVFLRFSDKTTEIARALVGSYYETIPGNVETNIE